VARQPGWYRNPDDPRSLRYWDGSAWGGRPRRRPPWAVRTASFELGRRAPDRSVEGPVHYRELRQVVSSGAGRRQRGPWRPRGPGAATRGPSGREAQWPPELKGPATPVKAGLSRRPLAGLVCLVAVGIAVVVSSVAFMRPYETRGYLQAANEAAAARFAAKAEKQCNQVLPRYRAVLAKGTDKEEVAAAVQELRLLRARLAAIPVAPGMAGPVEEWLSKLSEYADARARSVEGASAGGAVEATTEASLAAERADAFSASFQLTACRLEPVAATSP
jgi:hypothetical protein